MTVDEWRTYRRPATSSVDQLDWPSSFGGTLDSSDDFDLDSYTERFAGFDGFDSVEGLSDLDAELDMAAYSPDPSITHQDVYASLGPQAGEMLRTLDVDVDELIRLINAETTLLPVIDVELPPAKAVPALAVEQPEPELVTTAQKWKKRFLKGAVIAVLATLAGGGVALAMNKSVTVNVDGKNQVVSTYGSTVGDVLDDAGIKVGPHDALSLSPSAEIGDDGVIKLERGRQLSVIIDGKQQQTWVRATDVREALQQMGKSHLAAQGAWMSAEHSESVPLKGMILEIKTLKQVKFIDGGEKAQTVKTHAVTVEEFLKAKGVKIGAQDEVENGLSRSIKDGSTVEITRTGTSVVKIKEPIEPPVKEIEDDTLEQGKEKVVEEGKAGLALVTYRVTKENNVEIARKELDKKVLRKAEQRVVKIGTKQPETPPIADGEVWDRLAECESGGDWSINTGNGYYGGLQFNKGTWDAYGGDAYANLPSEATREQQIAIATKLRDANGGSYGAWPHCSAQLGLPN